MVSPLLLLELLVGVGGFVLTLAVSWRVSKGGGGSAVTELSKANEVLTHRVKELGDEVRDLRIENAKLKARTDYQAVISEHEKRAQARHEAQLHVLELIASRLGPDPNGA